MEVLESQNKEFGFYGTIVDEEILSVETEWASAFQWIAAIMTKWSAEDIRNFLDCHYGHSLANDAMVCEGIMNVPHKWWIKSFFIHAENVGLQEKTPLLEIFLRAKSERDKVGKQIYMSEIELGQILQTVPEHTEEECIGNFLREYISNLKADLQDLIGRV